MLPIPQLLPDWRTVWVTPPRVFAAVASDEASQGIVADADSALGRFDAFSESAWEEARTLTRTGNSRGVPAAPPPTHPLPTPQASDSARASPRRTPHPRPLPSCSTSPSRRGSLRSSSPSRAPSAVRRRRRASCFARSCALSSLGSARRPLRRQSSVCSQRAQSPTRLLCTQPWKRPLKPGGRWVQSRCKQRSDSHRRSVDKSAGG